MNRNRPLRFALLSVALLSLTACGGGMFGSNNEPGEDPFWESRLSREQHANMAGWNEADKKSTLRDLFRSNDSGANVRVNRYLWNASLDVLNFLPVESVDPFTGVISTGYGTPPGGRQAYRATVYVQDSALDARSLKIALQTRGGGPVSAEVASRVEDAILTRARQLRAADSRL